MNPFSKITSFFKKVGNLIKRGLKFAYSNGLSEEVVKMALVWVRVAAVKFADNQERRNFVIKILVARGIPESIARMAVEFAVQLFKKEILALELPSKK